MNSYRIWARRLPDLQSWKAIFILLIGAAAFLLAWLFMLAADQYGAAWSAAAQVFVLVAGYLNVAQFFRRRKAYQQRWGDQAYRNAFLLRILPGLLWIFTAIAHTIRLPGENILPGWSTLPVNILAWYLCLTGLVLDLRAIQAFGWDNLALVYVYYPQEGRMVDSSIYQVLRHPVYSAVMRISIAFGLWGRTWASLAIGLLLPVLFYYFWIRRVEEPDLIERFGSSYIEYRKKTPAYWPRLKDWQKFWRFLLLGRPRSAALLLVATLLLSGCSTKPAFTTGDVNSFVHHLDTTVPANLQKHSVPGMSIALIHNGQVVWDRGYGVINKNTSDAPTKNHVFQAASISKSLTAWGVMHLVDAGKIDLDAPFSQYLKTWPLPASKYDVNGVTVRRLLSHTAGLAAWYHPGKSLHEQPLLPEQLLAEKPLEIKAEPGTVYRYSNGDYVLLQMLIEEVSGTPFDMYMESEVFKPLGMTHSSFYATPAATLYVTGYDAGGKEHEVRWFPEGAGGLFTTASDLAIWLAASMPGPQGEPPGRGIISPETFQEMRTPVPITKGSGDGLGYALETLPSGDQLLTHTGEVDGWRGMYAAYPDRGEGIVVLTNSNLSRYVIADVICTWSNWVAGAVPAGCKFYPIVRYGVIGLAALVALLAVINLTRLILRLRSGRAILSLPGKADNRGQSTALALLVIPVWWLYLTPKLKALLPPELTWLSIAITLLFLVSAAKELVVSSPAEEPATPQPR